MQYTCIEASAFACFSPHPSGTAFNLSGNKVEVSPYWRWWLLNNNKITNNNKNTITTSNIFVLLYFRNCGRHVMSCHVGSKYTSPISSMVKRGWWTRLFQGIPYYRSIQNATTTAFYFSVKACMHSIFGVVDEKLYGFRELVLRQQSLKWEH